MCHVFIWPIGKTENITLQCLLSSEVNFYAVCPLVLAHLWKDFYRTSWSLLQRPLLKSLFTKRRSQSFAPRAILSSASRTILSTGLVASPSLRNIDISWNPLDKFSRGNGILRSYPPRYKTAYKFRRAHKITSILKPDSVLLWEELGLRNFQGTDLNPHRNILYAQNGTQETTSILEPDLGLATGRVGSTEFSPSLLRELCWHVVIWWWKGVRQCLAQGTTRCFRWSSHFKFLS